MAPRDEREERKIENQAYLMVSERLPIELGRTACVDLDKLWCGSEHNNDLGNPTRDSRDHSIETPHISFIRFASIDVQRGKGYTMLDEKREMRKSKMLSI